MPEALRDPANVPDGPALADVLRAFQDAWNAHDPRALAATFAHDADFANVVGMRAHGRDAIEAFHRPAFETMFAASRLEFGQVLARTLGPEVAAVDAEWTMTGARDPAGNPIPRRAGLATAVLGREGSAWRIAVFHNQDLPAGPADAPVNPYAGMLDR